MDVVNVVLKNEPVKADPRGSTDVQKDSELDVDEGTLLVSDYNVLNQKALRSQPETYLKGLTRDNVQLLINRIWDLPTERIEDVIVAKLPKPLFILPRTRAAPKPKPLTKWQQFAKEKGIKSKKREKSKLKWDDELQQWIPTYGYKRVKTQKQKEWLVEVGKDGNPLEDPFAAKKTAKEERRSKNELQRLRNLARVKNVKLPKVGLPSTEHFQSANQLATAITVARSSTASLGKFQERLPKEKDAKGIAREVSGLKRKDREPLLNPTQEKVRNAGILSGVLKNNKKTVLQEDFSTSSTGASTSRDKRKGKSGKNKSAKKPKAGGGKRNLHTKVGGRKRR